MKNSHGKKRTDAKYVFAKLSSKAQSQWSKSFQKENVVKASTIFDFVA